MLIVCQRGQAGTSSPRQQTVNITSMTNTCCCVYSVETPDDGQSICSKHVEFFHSFSSLSYDRSKASSKASSPHSAIQSFLLQMRASSSFLKVIQFYNRVLYKKKFDKQCISCASIIRTRTITSSALHIVHRANTANRLTVSGYGGKIPVSMQQLLWNDSQKQERCNRYTALLLGTFIKLLHLNSTLLNNIGLKISDDVSQLWSH